MNHKTRLSVGTAIAATTLIAGSAAYAVGSSATSGTKGTPGQFAPHTSIIGNAESSVVTVAPCRAVDTRHGVGLVATGATKTFSITGTNLSAQGGSATGCKIPTYASAVLLNVTVTGTTGGGYVTVFPSVPKPVTSTVNFTAAGQTIANGATIGLSPTGTVSVYAAKGTHVIIDVTGYTVATAAASVYSSATPSVYSKTARVGALTRNSTGYFSLAVAGATNKCWASATLESSAGSASASPATGSIEIRTRDASGTPSDLDSYVDVVLHC